MRQTLRGFGKASTWYLGSSKRGRKERGVKERRLKQRVCLAGIWDDDHKTLCNLACGIEMISRGSVSRGRRGGVRTPGDEWKGEKELTWLS